MRLSIATKVFVGFVAVLICSASVSLYGIVRLQRIGRGLSLLARPYMPLTRAVSTLEAFQKERERSTDRLLEEQDPAARRSLISLDRTYFARVVKERLDFAQQLVASATGPGGAAASSPRWRASSTPWRSGWRRASGSCAPREKRWCAPSGWRRSGASPRRSRTRSAIPSPAFPSTPRSWGSAPPRRASCAR